MRIASKLTNMTARIFATFVLVTAQITPFLVFNTQRVFALNTGASVPTSTHAPNNWDVNTVENV
jgi:hypothetical protein